MELNLIGALTMFKTMDMVPNFSELARAFGRDRHTIKKMYEGKGRKRRKKRASELDAHVEEMTALLSRPGTSVKAAYWFLKNERGIKCSYDNFKRFVKAKGISGKAKAAVPHPLYETDPGQQLQVDWVESMRLTTTKGEPLEFNLFSATLGYSRLHYFEYTEFKQEADFKRCLVHAFEWLGGMTKEVLTDNMSAVVAVDGRGGKSVHPSMSQFFKDLGVKLRLCRVRSPQTKGKDEVSNKFPQWLAAYDGRVEDRAHLLRLIERLNADINRQKNTGTNIPPALLFEKEKEHLTPLPSRALLDSYEDEMRSCKVPSTFTVTYKGAKYSVPPYLITKTVAYKERCGRLLIYHRGELVAEHDLKAAGTVNYQRPHYEQGLLGRLRDEGEIDELAARNLARFKDLGE